MPSYFSTSIDTGNLVLVSSIRQVSLVEYFVSRFTTDDMHVFIDIPASRMYIKTPNLPADDLSVLESNIDDFQLLTKANFETERDRILNNS